jgi:hypothetical protein
MPEAVLGVDLPGSIALILYPLKPLYFYGRVLKTAFVLRIQGLRFGNCTVNVLFMDGIELL